MEYTTIKLEKKTKKMLDDFKVHPRQSYEEIINMLVSHCKDAVKRGDLEIFKKK